MRLRNVKNKDDILNKINIIILDPEKHKGNWHIEFNNSNPIYLEIGSGKCSFIINKALNYPNINFIGIEKNDNALALGLKEKDTSNLKNLRIVKYDASLIDNLFDNEIDTLYLNFSDPWPKDRHEKRRLTYHNFLETYDLIFKKTKTIELKTDNQNLFEYSLKSLSNYGYKLLEVSIDLHNSLISDNILTEYEIKFAKSGLKILFFKASKQ